jgi:hypothetical protein
MLDTLSIFVYFLYFRVDEDPKEKMDAGYYIILIFLRKTGIFLHKY